MKVVFGGVFIKLIYGAPETALCSCSEPAWHTRAGKQSRMDSGCFFFFLNRTLLNPLVLVAEIKRSRRCLSGFLCTFRLKFLLSGPRINTSNQNKSAMFGVRNKSSVWHDRADSREEIKTKPSEWSESYLCCENKSFAPGKLNLFYPQPAAFKQLNRTSAPRLKCLHDHFLHQHNMTDYPLYLSCLFWIKTHTIWASV